MLSTFEQYEKELDIYKNLPIMMLELKYSRIILLFIFLITTSVIQIKTKTTKY